MKLTRSLFFWIFILHYSLSFSQDDPKNYYNVSFYNLEVQLAPDLKRIAGKNEISFHTLRKIDSIHFDVKKPLKIARVTLRGRKLRFKQSNHQVSIKLPYNLAKGTKEKIEILFAGDLRGNHEWRPVWSKDYLNQDLIAVTSEELSPESWWPVKNHLGDMPDSMHLAIIYPEKSKVISSIPHKSISILPGGFIKWDFHYSYPIHPYQIGFHIGNFVSVKDSYTNESGEHPIEIFSPRSQNSNSRDKIDKIKEYFTFLEKYYGPYPFWGSGFQWFEMPAPAAEKPANNQQISAVNANDQGLYRQLFSNWFGRTINPASPEDQWIFETLMVYNEVLYLEEQGNEDLAIKYLQNLRSKMGAPVLYMDSNLDNLKLKKQIGIKGAWFFHTLRIAVNNDALWFQTLKSFVETHQQNPVSTEDFYSFMNFKLQEEYDIIFDQFLKNRKLPVFHYKVKRKSGKLTFSYRWEADSPHFNLPINIKLRDDYQQIVPTKEWKSIIKKGVKENQVSIESDGLFKIREDR